MSDGRNFCVDGRVRSRGGTGGDSVEGLAAIALAESRLRLGLASLCSATPADEVSSRDSIRSRAGLSTRRRFDDSGLPTEVVARRTESIIDHRFRLRERFGDWSAAVEARLCPDRSRPIETALSAGLPLTPGGGPSLRISASDARRWPTELGWASSSSRTVGERGSMRARDGVVGERTVRGSGIGPGGPSASMSARESPRLRPVAGDVASSSVDSVSEADRVTGDRGDIRDRGDEAAFGELPTLAVAPGANASVSLSIWARPVMLVEVVVASRAVRRFPRADCRR